MIATITTKGQITIPAMIREHFDLNQGDQLEFEISDNEIKIHLMKNRVIDVFGSLYQSDQKAISIEEMNQSIKNKMKK